MATANGMAATLTVLSGIVQVNKGEGFYGVAGAANVSPGDRVRVTNGVATIAYENGCSVQLGPDQLAVVLASPPSCPQKRNTDNNPTSKNLASNNTEGSNPTESATGFSNGTLILGGLVVAGAVGAVVALSSSGNKPASP
jgi:hypothetical protein